MSFGAGVRARLAALPVLALFPWRCHLDAPPSDAGPAPEPARRASPPSSSPGSAPPSGAASVTPSVAVPGAPSVAASGAAVSGATAGGTSGARIPTVPSGASAAIAKQEPAPARVPPAPPSSAGPSARAITLPEEVVIKTLGGAQPAFLRCWARAQRIDGLEAAKVRIHLELDARGRVLSIQTDSESPTLSACLAVVARQLAFPAPGQPAVVDAPLMFR